MYTVVVRTINANKILSPIYANFSLYRIYFSSRKIFGLFYEKWVTTFYPSHNFIHKQSFNFITKLKLSSKLYS